jgi:hypothetical protein
MMDAKEIAERFSARRGTTETEVLRQSQIHSEIEMMFEDFALRMNLMVADSREKSLALTALEETQVWFTKAYDKQYPVDDRLVRGPY